MTAYFVYVRDDRENKPEVRMEHYYGWATDPPEPVWCADVVKAETPAQAKHRFLVEWAGTMSTPVDWDDWPNLRVRILDHDDEASNDALWGRIHEILDHDSKPCDCPEVE